MKDTRPVRGTESPSRKIGDMVDDVDIRAAWDALTPQQRSAISYEKYRMNRIMQAGVGARVSIKLKTNAAPK